MAAEAWTAGRRGAEGETRVARMPCRVYRSLHPLVSRVLTGAPTADDHVDTCIDADGLGLEERQVVGGRRFGSKRATVVTVGTQTTPPHDYTIDGTPIPLDKGGGRITELTAASKPPGEPFWELTSPPAGFTRVGRFAVIPPQPRVSLSVGVNGIATSVDDVFVRGPDLIVIEQGHRPEPVRRGGRPVDLGGLGRGRLFVSGVASWVTAKLVGVGYVEVRGTLAPRQLVAVARSLTKQPPGTLVTVPGGPTES